MKEISPKQKKATAEGKEITWRAPYVVLTTYTVVMLAMDVEAARWGIPTFPLPVEVVRHILNPLVGGHSVVSRDYSDEQDAMSYLMRRKKDSVTGKKETMKEVAKRNHKLCVEAMRAATIGGGGGRRKQERRKAKEAALDKLMEKKPVVITEAYRAFLEVSFSLPRDLVNSLSRVAGDVSFWTRPTRLTIRPVNFTRVCYTSRDTPWLEANEPFSSPSLPLHTRYVFTSLPSALTPCSYEEPSDGTLWAGRAHRYLSFQHESVVEQERKTRGEIRATRGGLT